MTREVVTIASWEGATPKVRLNKYTWNAGKKREREREKTNKKLIVLIINLIRKPLINKCQVSDASTVVCWRISVFIWVSDILLLDYNSEQKHDKNRGKFPKLFQVMMPEFWLPVATPHTSVPRLQVENVSTLAARLPVFLDKNREVVLIFPWSEGLNFHRNLAYQTKNGGFGKGNSLEQSWTCSIETNNCIHVLDFGVATHA